LAISCGACVAHLGIAMQHFGFTPEVQLLPDPDRPDLLARVSVIGTGVAEPADNVELFAAIPRRRTYRLPFEPLPVDGGLVERLVAAAAREHASLVVIAPGDPRRLPLAELIEEGDRTLAHDPAFRAEQAEWVRDAGAESHDGIPARALGHSELADRLGSVVRFLMRHVDFGHERGRRDRNLVLAAPVLAVLCTANDSREWWLRAGQALSRVLLAARRAGVSASFFTQPVLVPELRQRLRALMGTECWPHLVLRLGYGRDVEPTPRRGADEMLLHRGPLPGSGGVPDPS
jgi:hypothetical protein